MDKKAPHPYHAPTHPPPLPQPPPVKRVNKCVCLCVQGLQGRLCGLVKEVQQRPRSPYGGAQCRQLLYQALLAAVCVPCPDPLALQQVVSLLQHGALDTDFGVS